MYRAGGLNALFEHGPGTFVDFYVYIHLASLGCVGTIDAVLGGYTMGVGVSTKMNLIELVAEALQYARTLGLDQATYLRVLSRHYFGFAKKAFVEGQYDLFSRLIQASVQTKVFSPLQVMLYLLRSQIWLIRSAARILK
jgi:hypothetical protein